ncbi:hypothetical protein [Pseudomonas savastanoi]|uniref:hypothetical protein n=1 Tax=Pseudomonas savastanoi TaxID=29438 RepID=UPI001CB858C2|nr:hypothetical protein [Pseudomonas savastanoi]
MTKKLPHPISHYQNGKEILQWSIKTIARPPKEILLAELAIVFIYATILSFGLWAGWAFYSKDSFQAIYIVASTSGGAVYFILLGNLRTSPGYAKIA